MTSHLSLSKSQSYTLHIGGTGHVLSMEELRILRDRIDRVLGTHRWEVGKKFFADPGQEPPRDVWLKDRTGDFAGWVSKSESSTGQEGWTWVEWSDGHRATYIPGEPWDEFAPGFEFTVVEAK